MLFSVLALAQWLVVMVLGAWFLLTVKEMRDELKTIRRYLQAMHDQWHQK